MVPSINLASDSLGIGGMFQGISSVFTSGSKGTDACGSKPTCISIGKNSQCAMKNKAYYDCVSKSQDIKMSEATKPVTNSTPPIFLVATVIIVIILIIFLTRK